MQPGVTISALVLTSQPKEAKKEARGNDRIVLPSKLIGSGLNSSTASFYL